MKQRKWRVLLSMVLAFCLCLSAVVPVSAAGVGGTDDGSVFDDWLSDMFGGWFGEEDEDQTQDDSLTTYASSTDLANRIVHLDCGRKYFSVNYIKGVIDAMYANGFNQLELAFGNGGLRFVLDKSGMDIKNGTSTLYNSADVISAIEEGNKNFYNDPNGNCLTESDMKQIIAYANKKGIEIVPLLNMPGHMDGLLSSSLFSQYKLSGSEGSLDLNNSYAVDFGKALLKLYVDWFRANSATTMHFNFGADEYGQGIRNPYIESSVANVTYDQLVSYMNDCAKIIEDKSMTARCFNDFVCYNKRTSCDLYKTVQVCYWSNQWNGSEYNTPDVIKNAGYKMINTSQKWYFVPSKGGNEYSKNTVLSNFSTFDVTKFQNIKSGDNSTSTTYTEIKDASNIGAMFCVWCDVPSGDVSLTDVQKLIAAMADANPTYFTKVTLPTITAGDNVTKDADGTYKVLTNKEFTLSVSGNKTATWTVDKADVVELTEVNTAAANSANDIAVYSSEIEANAVTVKALKAGTATIKATLEDKTELTATVAVADPGTENIVLEVGDETTVTLDEIVAQDGDVLLNDGIANVTASVTSTPGGMTKKLGDLKKLYSANNGTYDGVIYSNGHYMVLTGTTISATDDINEATIFKVTKQWGQSGSYYTIAYGKYYLCVSNDNLTANRSSFNWSCGSGSDYYSGSNVLAYKNGSWTVAYNDWDNAGRLYSVTEKTTDPVSKTPLTFTGVTVGVTSVIINGVKYNITVKSVSLKDKYIYINYFITNQRVTGDADEKKSIRINATDEGIDSEEGVTLKSVVSSTGTYTTDNTTNKVIYYKSEYQNGIDIQTHQGWTNKIGTGVTAEKIRFYNGKWSVFNGSEWIDIVGNTKTDPETYANEDATAPNGISVITAYYLLVTDVTKEVTTNATDWGEKIGTEFTNGYSLLDFAVKYESGERVPDSFANSKTLVYNNAAERDYVYGDSSDKARYIKDIYAQNNSAYEVYMITVTESDALSASNSKNTTASTEITYNPDNEKVVWVLSETDLANSSFNDDSKKYEGFEIGGDPIVKNIYAANKHGYLVTYYIRAKSAKLHVYYYIEGANEPFYDYGINVLGDTTFDPGFALTTNGLINNTVKNDKDVLLTVTDDLSKMPAVPAQYRYSDYNCVRVSRDNDGTAVRLYYNISSDVTFVVDFGLPFVITPGDINKALNNATLNSASVSEFLSGNGYVKIDTVTNCEEIKVTPIKTIDGVINFKLTYYGSIPVENGNQEGSVTYNVKILPASNVYYEENFATKNERNWTFDGSESSRIQSTETLSSDSHNNYGYDVSYANDSRYSGGHAYKCEVKLNDNYLERPLARFSFWGTGFDIISECDRNTGILYVKVTDDDGNLEKAYIVDTYFEGDNQEIMSNTMTYQIPVVRCTKALKYGHHNVSVAGMIINNSGAVKGISPASTMSMDDYDSSDAVMADLYAKLEELGVTEEEMADLEFIYMDENSIFNGGTGATPETTISTDSRVSFYAANATDTGKYYVYFDGYRIYNPLGFTEDVIDGYTKASYDDDEAKVKYVPVYDAVSSEDGNDKNFVYIETDPDTVASRISTELDWYRKIGPYNEIYLAPNKSIVLKTNAEEGQTIQISAKIVDNRSVTNSTFRELTTATEMYYDVAVGAGGLITISNLSEKGEGVLSISEMKLPEGVNPVSMNEADRKLAIELVNALYAAPVDPEPEEPEIFEPDYLYAYTLPVTFRRVGATITVTSSTESGMEVYIKAGENGKVEKLDPINTRMVRWGIADKYIYSFNTRRLNRGEYTYYVYAVMDGVMSEPIPVSFVVW